MYIKLDFSIQRWVLPQCSAGSFAILSRKPEIVDEIPKDVDIKKNSLLANQSIFTGGYTVYYYDCQGIERQQIEKALQSFIAHYYDDSHPSTPGTGIGYERFDDNEIIQNLKIALDNVKNDSPTPFKTNQSSSDIERKLARIFM